MFQTSKAQKIDERGNPYMSLDQMTAEEIEEAKLSFAPTEGEFPESLYKIQL